CEGRKMAGKRKGLLRAERPLTGRILFCSATITVAVLMLTSVILFFLFRSQVEKEYGLLTNSALSNVDVTFDGYLNNAANWAYQWYESYHGTKCRVDRDYNPAENMMHINEIRWLLAGSPYLHSVFFLNRDREIALNIGENAPYLADVDGLLQRTVSANGVSRPFLWKAVNRFPGREAVTLLSVYFAEASIESANYTGGLVVNLEAEQLSHTLFSDNLDRGLDIYILDGNGIVAASSKMEYCGEDWSFHPWVKEILDGNTDSGENSGERIYWISSRQKGFYVVARVDGMTGFTNISRTASVIFGLMFIAAILIMVMLLPVFRRILQPMRYMVSDIREQFPEEEGKDELKILNRHYERLTNQIQALRSEGEKNYVIKNLLLGNRNAGVQDILIKNDAVSSGKGYFLVTAYLSVNGSRSKSMQEFDILREIIQNVYCSCLGGLGKCTCFEVGLRRVLFVLSEGAEKQVQKDVWEKVLDAEQDAESRIQISVTSLMSERIEDGTISCMPYYEKLENQLKARILLGNEESCCISETESMDMTELEEIIQQLLNDGLRTGNKEIYLKKLEELLELCHNQPYDILESILGGLARRIVRVKAEMSKRQVQEAEQALQVREQLDHLQGYEDLMEWFEQLYEEAATEIQKIVNHSSEHQLEQAVDYIRNNYDDAMLNVNMLADKLNMSAAYFGKLFREFTGCSAVEYITRTRMEKAREMLLTESEKDIGKIAEAVGYSSNAYFATIFKKHYGVPPSKFRDYHSVAEFKRES
ncbi:MAG: AraC family transcriptional regulator, partial [Ruminococcus flavefaciens]|nr:AraC family transcriptional regulator [Ruminococcus flavefaciens]